MTKIFERNVKGLTEVLNSKTVAIAGLGGLGSNAAIALARSGVGKLKLADFDIVEWSNLNRQHYFREDVGKRKTKALAKHLLSINMDLEISLFEEKLHPNNLHPFFKDADLLIEAFDKAENKLFLIDSWCKLYPAKPIIIGSGLSGYGKTTDLKVEKMGNIYFCGDGKSGSNLGLTSSRVAIVANMQANVAIELLFKGEIK
jgi:sulfur carrier protein ThiS adenylyltransferase